MNQLPDVLESGEPARLLPVVKDSQLEDRATSILLATMLSVRGLATDLLDGIGPHIGRRATLSAYSQVVLRNRPDDSKLRPDGLIEIATGSRRWRALIEGKILRAEHNEEQIHS